MFTLKFTTGNAAFCNYDGYEDEYMEAQECGRILEEIAKKVKGGYRDGLVMDINGNHIGEWELK